MKEIMNDGIIHAIVMVNNWGNDDEILKIIKNNNHIISIFHIMGRHSYLLDANFDDKKQLSAWINQMKSIMLPSGVPAITSIQTQRIIEVHKRKKEFTLEQYLNMKEKKHFFVQIDCPSYVKGFLDLLKKSQIVHSIIHIQGENSFTLEAVTEDYSDYKKLLKKIKKLKNIKHIETQEVISVLKYRNQIFDEARGFSYQKDDIRMLYSF